MKYGPFIQNEKPKSDDFLIYEAMQKE